MFSPCEAFQSNRSDKREDTLTVSAVGDVGGPVAIHSVYGNVCCTVLKHLI